MKAVKFLFAVIIVIIAALVSWTMYFSLAHRETFDSTGGYPFWFFGLFICLFFFLLICGLLVAILVHRRLVSEADLLKQLNETLQEREQELEKTNRELNTSRDETMKTYARLEQDAKDLAAGEERYKALVDSVTDYIHSVEVKNGKIVSRGDGSSCIAVTGYTEEEFEQDPDLWDKIVFDEDRENEIKYRKDLLAGKPAPVREFRINHKAGHICWIKTTAVPHYDSDGKIISYDELISNVTERKKAELDLLTSEEKFRLAFENARDAIVWADPETGIIVDCNQATENFVKRKKADIIGKSFALLHPEEKREEYAIAFKKHASEKGCFDNEYEMIDSKGNIIPVSLSSSVTFVGGKNIVQGIFRNISSEIQARETLASRARQLEALYRIISSANSAPNLEIVLQDALQAVVETLAFDGGGIYLLDKTGKMAEIVCSMGLPDNFVAAVSKIETSNPAYKSLFLEGLPIVIENYNSLKPVRAWMGNLAAVASVPITTGDSIIGALNVASKKPRETLKTEIDLLVSVGKAIGTAISRMKSELSLRESEEQYRTITEQSIVGIFIIKNRKFIFANHGFAKIVGYTKKEIELWSEQDFENLIVNEDKQLFREHIMRLPPLKEESGVSLHDYRIKTKAREEKWMMLYFKSVRLGKEIVFSGMALDITYRKRMERSLSDINLQLRKRSEELFDAIEQLKTKEYDLIGANVEKEILLKEIHHRVKNNFQVVSSLLNIQLSKVTDPDASEIIKNCLNRIKSMSIVHEKLYTAGNFAGINLKDYTETLSSHLMRVYSPGKTNITFSVDGSDTIVSINQAVPCCLILNELISNSLKHAFKDRKEGKITIFFDSDTSGNINIRISDNGTGFPVDFDLSETETLGMQLVTTFVNQLSGKISVEKANGEGVAFTILFNKN